MDKKKLKGKKLNMYEALKSELGVVTTACKLVGISRETHYSWLRKDENYKIWVESIQDITLDFAENALLKQIKDGNTSSILFYLKTKGKNRGYIEKPENQITFTKQENKLIQVNIPESVKALLEAERNGT